MSPKAATAIPRASSRRSGVGRTTTLIIVAMRTAARLSPHRIAGTVRRNPVVAIVRAMRRMIDSNSLLVTVVRSHSCATNAFATDPPLTDTTARNDFAKPESTK